MWRRADDEQHDENDNKENTEISIQNGVVTRFCDDYGMVNDLVCFTNAVVVAHIPLFVGQKVNVIAQKDKTSGGWSAIRVEPVCDKWEEDGNRISASGLPDLDNPKSLVGSITSCNEDGGCINQTVYFSMENVCEGFQPYRGDWVQAEYYVNPAKWTSFACFVKPLRYKRFDKVTVSSVHGRNGVIDDAIFFTLDSLRLRENYLPRRNDVVNVVGVESSQSCYSWRALCMAPAFRNGLSSTTTFEKDETIENLLTRNKGGLQVSRLTDFGTIVQGESKNILIWIENKGDEAHSLISCKLARWDKENQFRIELHIEGNRAEPNDVTAARSTSVSVHNPISETSAHAGQYSPFNLLLHVPVKTRMLQLPLHSPGTTSDAPGDKMNRMNVLNREAEQVFHIADGAKNSSLKGSNVTLNGDVAEGKNVEATEHVLVIAPGEKTSIIVWCIAKNPGRCRELLLLCFSDFVIGRYIAVNVVAKEECHVGPAEPYRPKSFSFKQETTGRKVLIPAPSSTRLIRRQLPNFLPQYPIPKALRDSVEKQSDILVIQPCLAESLNMENYKKRFSTLLWLEDVQVENELNDFSMSAVILKKNGDLLVLEVPGISECRPSLYIGDRVILKSSEYSEKVVEYTSYVVEIHEEEVSLRVDLAFQKTYNGEPMDVEFLFNRTTSRRCQFAVEQALHLGERVLFPESIDIQKPQILALWDGEETFHEELNKKQKNKKTKEGQSKAVEDEDDKSAAVSISDVISVGTQVGTAKADGLGMKKECGFPFFNPILNEHQRMAVKRILSAECRPIPYILFGPPGTGKTITIIETILQIHFTLADSRILACTPSNSAADLLCVRLHETSLLRPGSMVRVNATTRMEESMDEIVKSYSKDGEDIWQASRFRIIICTCSSAGMFYQIGVRMGHFTHVFIDEAGQASEPECLIPLGLVSEQDGQIVLTGDPMQLGPVVKSRLARVFGLNVSLLERLMMRPMYSRDETAYSICGSYNPLLVTKLVKNYRSHSALLSLPSRLFYHKELLVCADERVASSLHNWEKLPKKGFPLIFHGLRGNEMREGSSPSWFNPSEAVQVMRYCCLLVRHAVHPVSVADIGVITPYRKQVEKIRILLRSVDLPEIKVGSVEEFQGREYLAIIISTVRSSEDHLNEDARYVVGFLSNPKRFNVAVTRPKALLIMVGNPHILIKDPCFGAFLEYCAMNGACVGCDLPPEIEVLQGCD